MVLKARGFIMPALVLLAVLVGFSAQPALAQLLNGQTPIAGKTIPKYVEALPTFVGARVDAATYPNLTVRMKEVTQQVLPAANPALGVIGYPMTTVWGYEINDGVTTYSAHYPSFTIEAKRGTPVQVTYYNELDKQTLYTPIDASIPGILPVDQTLHWADPLDAMGTGTMATYSGPVPAVVHLHGGEVSSKSDGGPDAWFTPGFLKTGRAWHLAAADRVSNVYEYPNSQETATIWYHDHALGVTRLNVYAGLAGFYFLRDNNDTGLPTNSLKLPAGNYEIELAIQDRMFDTMGRLYFPNLGINPTVHPFWLPEFFGDVIVVNGKTWPYSDVEPRRYRFHFLDGSNARFYDMWLQNLATGAMGPAFYQIGTDGGFLDGPVMIDPAQGQRLLMTPGERADIIIDFSGYAGQTLTLKNGAKAPFPKGAAADPKTVGQIMQFRVIKPMSGTDNSYNPAGGGSLRGTPLVRLVTPNTVAPAVIPDYTRQLTLNEVMGALGPLEVLVNNTKWDAPITENPREGDTEAWKIVNLTADAHPIHLHLVQFQLVSRQAFNVTKYNKAYAAAFPGGTLVDPMTGISTTYAPGVFMPAYGPPLGYNTGVLGLLGGNPDINPYLQGAPRPANPNEQGWKDTFVMYPGEVTTVIARWAPTDLPASTPRGNLRFTKFQVAEGPGYVWHCHIIDHEDNEMMRPYKVLANVTPASPVLAGRNGATVATVGEKPTEFSLGQNYPNPFNPSTEIRFSLPEDSHVKLVVYNSLGQEVKTLLDSDAPAGYHTVRLDGRGLASGVYYYRISAGSFVSTKRMLLMK
jgi:spore coat protein A